MLHTSSARMPNPMFPVGTLSGRPVFTSNTSFSVPELFMAITHPLWSMMGLPLVPPDKSRLCCTKVVLAGVIEVSIYGKRAKSADGPILKGSYRRGCVRMAHFSREPHCGYRLSYSQLRGKAPRQKFEERCQVVIHNNCSDIRRVRTSVIMDGRNTQSTRT